MTRRGRAGAAAALGAALLLGACAGAPPQRPAGVPAPPEDPPGVRGALLARNAGLGEVRAAVEARVSFAGVTASFPGALVMRGRGAFRLDLLDPLDRPLAIVFAEGRRIVQYRPAGGFAASLGPFPEGCRDVDPGEWASVVVGDLPEPVPGERFRLWALWGRRTLEIERRGVLHESIVYRERAGTLLPERVSWYCGDDVVMQLRVRSWGAGGQWRLPERFEVSWPRANLAVAVQVREVVPAEEAVPVPLAPRLGAETRWVRWNLPQ